MLTNWAFQHRVLYPSQINQTTGNATKNSQIQTWSKQDYNDFTKMKGKHVCSNQELAFGFHIPSSMLYSYFGMATERDSLNLVRSASHWISNHSICFEILIIKLDTHTLIPRVSPLQTEQYPQDSPPGDHNPISPL